MGLKKRLRGFINFLPLKRGELIEREGLFDSEGSVGDLWYLSPYNCDQRVN